MIVKLVTHTYFFLHLSSKWGYTACEMLRFTSIVEFSAACSMHSFIWQRSKSRVISCTEHKQSHWFHTYYMSTTEPPIHQPTCFTNPYIPFHTSPLQSFLYSEAKTIPYTVKKNCAKCMSFWQLTSWSSIASCLSWLCVLRLTWALMFLNSLLWDETHSDWRNTLWQ